MNQQNYYRVSVKGVVIDESGRVLLAREDNGKWEMLGGGLDHGEDPIDCLKREINEETGLVVTSVSQQPVYFVTAPRLGHDSYVANVVYRIELENLAFVPSDECQELRFFSPEDMDEVELFPNVEQLRAVMRKAETN